MARNILADRLKGYACFLVLFGHVIMGARLSGVEMPLFFHGLERFIWSFHVPLFLFLSGVVYALTGQWQSKGTRGNFIKHKLLNLGIPYVIFSAVYIGINSFASQANTHFSLWDVLYIWKTPVAQYWYLYALFFLFCVWTGLSGSLKNWQITVVVVLAGYVAPLFDVSFGCFEVVIFSALAFGLGTFLNLSKIEKMPLALKIVLLVSHVVLGVVFIKLNCIESTPFKELMLVWGIISSVVLIEFLQKIRPIASFLDFINRFSFQIYLLHTIFTAGIRIVLIRFGMLQWWVHIVVGCVAGLLISVMVAVVAQKLKVINLCFFPTKTWRELKNSPDRQVRNK